MNGIPPAPARMPPGIPPRERSPQQSAASAHPLSDDLFELIPSGAPISAGVNAREQGRVQTAVNTITSIVASALRRIWFWGKRAASALWDEIRAVTTKVVAIFAQTRQKQEALLSVAPPAPKSLSTEVGLLRRSETELLRAVPWQELAATLDALDQKSEQLKKAAALNEGESTQLDEARNQIREEGAALIDQQIDMLNSIKSRLAKREIA